jgi:hypothetical protein
VGDVTTETTDLRALIEGLKRLEQRISRIESRLEIDATTEPVPEHAATAETANTDEDWLELRVGQFLVAQAGIVALVVGIAYLLTLPFSHVPKVVPVGIGYGLTAAMLLLARVARKSFPYVARCLLGGGLFLLYFTTLRLHFFVSDPLVVHPAWELAFLSLVAVFALIIAARSQSISLVGLGLILGYATAVISAKSYFLLPAVLLLSVLSVTLSLRHAWSRLIGLAMVLSYLAHTLWLINNPIMGGDVHVLAGPRVHLLFLMAYIALFAVAALPLAKVKEELYDPATELTHASINAASGYALYLLASVTSFPAQIALTQVVGSILFLALASVCWIRHRSSYATFVYAMVGYAALTVAIVARTQPPAVFMWLCWQSMLVLSSALWFRSKFIVVGNFAIYLGVLAAYLAASGGGGYLGWHFGAVALLSARVLNWQKRRLELRTEFMRNCYLVLAALILPYSLACLVSLQYLGLAWLGLALAYYTLSVVLKNKKYRWMALFTLLLTVLYVFLVGTIRLDPVYRIISMMVLGAAMLVVSLAYTRFRARFAGRTEEREGSTRG